LCSISDRGDYDLKNHSEKSGAKLEIDEIVPQVIEVSFGVERLMLAILENAYQEEAIDSGLTRTVLKLHPLLAPYFVAVIPLSKQLQEKAYRIYEELLTETNFTTVYEEASSIGKSYRRQDAIGTYYCLTVDFQTLQDDTVTIRERDSLKQIRLPQREIIQFLNQKYSNYYQELVKK